MWLKQQIIYFLTVLRVRVQGQAPLIRFLVKDLPFSLLIQLQISRLSWLFLIYIKWDMPQDLCTCCPPTPSWSGCWAPRPLHLFSPCLGALYLSTACSFTFSKPISTGFELTFISRNRYYHCKLSGAHNGHMINRILHQLWITEGPDRIWTYLAVILQFPFKWHLLGLLDHSVSLSSQDSLVPFPD